jgi:predicted HAD superfamily Cof-like phosphohydrolase
MTEQDGFPVADEPSGLPAALGGAGVTRWRKKAAEVEAIQWTGTNTAEVEAFCGVLEWNGAAFYAATGRTDSLGMVWNERQHGYLTVAPGYLVVRVAPRSFMPEPAENYEPADSEGYEPFVASSGERDVVEGVMPPRSAAPPRQIHDRDCIHGHDHPGECFELPDEDGGTVPLPGIQGAGNAAHASDSGNMHPVAAPLVMRTGKTLSQESPLTGGLVTIYRLTPEGQPDVCIGSCPPAEADRIVDAVNRCAELENMIGWTASCSNCAELMDAATAERERAERAEAASLETMLREFHAHFAVHGGLMPAVPVGHLPADISASRKALLAEELAEYGNARSEWDVVKIADAIADVIYVLAGDAVVYGLPLDALLAEVHRSNMTKVNDPASPKLVKGPAYEPPRIAETLSAAAEAGES